MSNQTKAILLVVTLIVVLVGGNWLWFKFAEYNHCRAWVWNPHVWMCR